MEAKRVNEKVGTVTIRKDGKETNRTEDAGKNEKKTTIVTKSKSRFRQTAEHYRKYEHN